MLFIGCCTKQNKKLVASAAMETFKTSGREGVGKGKGKVGIFVTLFGLQTLMVCVKNTGVNCLILKALAEKWRTLSLVRSDLTQLIMPFGQMSFTFYEV